MITVAYRNTRRLVLEMPLLVPTLEPRLQVADAEQDQCQQNASEDVQQSGHYLSVAYALQLARCTGSAATLAKTTSCSVINTGAGEISASCLTPSITAPTPSFASTSGTARNRPLHIATKASGTSIAFTPPTRGRGA